MNENKERILIGAIMNREQFTLLSLVQELKEEHPRYSWSLRGLAMVMTTLPVERVIVRKGLVIYRPNDLNTDGTQPVKYEV